MVENGRAKKVYKLTREGAAILYKELNGFYEIANSLIEIATEARKSLQEMSEGVKISRCPPDTILERLENLKDMLEEYIQTIREKLEKCKQLEVKR